MDIILAIGIFFSVALIVLLISNIMLKCVIMARIIGKVN